MNKKNTELFVLQLATVLTIIYAIIGVAIAVMTDSMTLLLDGLYSIADVIVSVIAIFVVKKIHEPPNKHYHYGYAKYEPLMTAVDGILITTICVGSTVTSIQDLIHPEHMDHIAVAVIYSFISFFVCIGIGLYIKTMGKKCDSEILKAEGELWFIEGIISIAVFVAFGISWMLERMGITGIGTQYIDPIMCIILSIALIYKPISLIKGSFQDLVDASPDALQNDIWKAVNECKEQHSLDNVHSVRIRKAGRYVFVSVCFATQQNLLLKRMHEISDLVTKRIQSVCEKADVFVSYRAA